MSIETTMWSYLKEKKLPEVSIAATMGNAYQESRFDPNEVEAGSQEGFGLFQWSFERRTKLEAYGTDTTHQLDFFWSELTGQNLNSTGASYEWSDKNGYLSHAQFMNGEGSIDKLTEAFCVCWERAGIPMMQTRIDAANRYYTQFVGTQPESANSQSSDITIEATNYQVVQNSQQYKDVIFGRRYRITVSDAQGSGIDVSQLRCTFNIVKTIQMQPNTSELVIYNLNAQTENQIMMTGARVTIEAGYEGMQFGLIFDGDILQTIREKENSTTYKLTILALDSDRAINFDIVNYSIVRGQTARNIVDYITSKAQYPVSLGSISDKLDGQNLTRGKVMFGKASDYLRQIAKSYDLQYYMDDGKLNLINMDDLPEGEAFELNSTSGLIGTPQQTDYGISGQCLLNPQIKLNTLIHIDNSLIRAKQINVNGGSTVPGGTTTIDNANSNGQTVRDAIVAEAKKLCDDPSVRYSEQYRNQTVNGITYYDCSAFTQHCYKIAGLDINPTSELQWAQVNAKGIYNIGLETALPGDLVFWHHGEDYDHVAIYGGNNDIYAARTDSKPNDEQVSYGFLYEGYTIGRPRVLIDADGGEFPSASGNNSNSTNNNSQSLFRGLDKDGIYRVIKITYEGDTRGNSWFVNFETIDQLGGAMPIVSN